MRGASKCRARFVDRCLQCLGTPQFVAALKQLNRDRQASARLAMGHATSAPGTALVAQDLLPRLQRVATLMPSATRSVRLPGHGRDVPRQDRLHP
jgi:hypothetical protein